MSRADRAGASHSISNGADDQPAAGLDDERLRVRPDVPERQEHPERVVPHVVRRGRLLVKVRLARRARGGPSSPALDEMFSQFFFLVLFLRERRLLGERRAVRGEHLDDFFTALALALQSRDVVLVQSLRAVVSHVVDVRVVSFVVDGFDGFLRDVPLGRIGLGGVEHAVHVDLVGGSERCADEGVEADVLVFPDDRGSVG